MLSNAAPSLTVYTSAYADGDVIRAWHAHIELGGNSLGCTLDAGPQTQSARRTCSTMVVNRDWSWLTCNGSGLCAQLSDTRWAQRVAVTGASGGRGVFDFTMVQR
jgi:hypothetical protein